MAETLAQWLARWTESYAPLRCQSRSTIERYISLARYLDATPPLRAVRDTPLDQLSHIAIQEAVISLLAHTPKRRSRLSARTVRHFGNLLNVALDRAHRLDLIATNPMRRVELPAFESRTARTLDEREMQSLRTTCAGDWTALFVELALGTGCRRGELLALTWSDWSGKRLTISKSIEQTRAGLRLKPMTKSKRPRVCTLPQVAIAALKAAQQTTTNVLVFADDDGQYRNPALVSQAVKRRLRKAKIRSASLHTLRHTHASLLLSHGVPLPAVSARLGHADPNITARIYSHALPPDDERAAEQWDRIIGV